MYFSYCIGNSFLAINVTKFGDSDKRHCLN